MVNSVPAQVPNWINGRQAPARHRRWIDKYNPADGTVLCSVAASAAEDVNDAVAGAVSAQREWGEVPGVRRGETLLRVAAALSDAREQVASIVALETGKSFKNALAETDGAIQLAHFFAGEGQRLYGRTTTSAVLNRSAMTIRCPVGIAGLIVPANTPIANVAWKVFPALVCGNAAVLKAAEDAPATAWAFTRIVHEAGLSPGLLQVVQGLGTEAGWPLVRHPDVAVISFTGSTRVGCSIARAVADRAGRVSLELGGKNALVVCDDADLDNAVDWVILSAFSNAGQRCAAASRVVVFETIRKEFSDRLLARVSSLRVGTADTDDFGPVINERQLSNMLAAIEAARSRGARVLTGGARLQGDRFKAGYFMAPTVLENVDIHDEISTQELFGPITCLYPARDFSDALAIANESPYGLTACIHTKSIHRAWTFVQHVQAGVAAVNAGTFGSEPHMPFGGVGLSGNGTREPGTEALDVYSSLKSVYLNVDPSQL